MLLISSGGLAVASLLIALFSGFIAVPGWPQDRDLAAAILLLYLMRNGLLMENTSPLAALIQRYRYGKQCEPVCCLINSNAL